MRVLQSLRSDLSSSQTFSRSPTKDEKALGTRSKGVVQEKSNASRDTVRDASKVLLNQSDN